MADHEKRSKVSIEDLLRLKQAERPSAEFWAGFERELRQKQLSALVEKRSWWHSLPQIFSRRVYLPIGATAILTFSLVSIRYYQPSQVVPVESTAAAPVSSFSEAPMTSSIASNPVPVSSPLVNRADHALVQAEARSESLVATPSSAEVALGSPSPDDSIATISPSARTIAANLSHLEQSDPELINAVSGSRLSSPGRSQISTVAVADLSNLPLGNAKRVRLLAHYSDRPVSAEPVAPDSVRERLSRRLGDSDLNDRWSRFGLKGDKVSLRF